jgi:hypothetical protein|tara:strand:- start:2584 stop:2766 length:183 start_codon:yes stop_codon:yes gene_type:complete
MNKRNERQLEQGGYDGFATKVRNGIKHALNLPSNLPADYRREGPRSSGGRNNPRGAKGAR